MPGSKPIICVDFDGVIHSYKTPWIDSATIRDPPVEGALLWLRELQRHFSVCVYSSRSKDPEGVEAMKRWLGEWAHWTWDSYDIESAFMAGLSFPTQKPAAFLTIDDRAICFDGDFSKLKPEVLLAFKPWNKKETST